MNATVEAQRLIAVSLGKIAMSRQQRGGINLHKNLLVASVLHKARTTYMMDNFQTLLANKRAQAEKEAAAKMIVETPSPKSQESTCSQSMEVSRGVNGNTVPVISEAPKGNMAEKNNKAKLDKENVIPTSNNCGNTSDKSSCDKSEDLSQKSCQRDSLPETPIVYGKQPLTSHNGTSSPINQLPACRCVGNKRRRSFVTESESVTEPKRPRYECDSDSSDSESDIDCESRGLVDTCERMETETPQVTSLVDIFSSGFNGLCKDSDNSSKQSSGQINVYVSADRSVAGHQYVLKDISCGTQIKDNVAIPTAIALAV